MSVIAQTTKTRFTLYGGVAGPGKTRTLIAWAAWILMVYAKYGHRARVILSSSDQRRVIERFTDEIHELLVMSGLGQVFGATKKGPAGFHFSDPAIGPIWFLGLQDIKKLKGLPDIAAYGIDELTELEELDFHGISWRGRFTGEPNPFWWQPNLNTSNPDGVGNYWVREYFVEKTFDTPHGANIKRVAGAKDFAYIEGNLSDNPNREYREAYNITLSMLPEHLRLARQDAVWNMTLGARFKHEPRVISFSDLPDSKIPAHWQHFMGIDWGSTDPACVIWAAFDDKKNCYVYRTLYITGLNVRQLAEKTRTMCDTKKWQPRMFGADPSMFAREAVERRGLNTYFTPFGFDLHESTNDHSVTNTLIEKFLEPDNGYPDLYILGGATDADDPKACYAPLIRDLKAVRFDPENKEPENLVPHEHTHSVYGLGYMLHKAWPSTTLIEAKDPIQAARAREYERIMRKGLYKKSRRAI